MVTVVFRPRPIGYRPVGLYVTTTSTFLYVIFKIQKDDFYDFCRVYHTFSRTMVIGAAYTVTRSATALAVTKAPAAPMYRTFL